MKLHIPKSCLCLEFWKLLSFGQRCISHNVLRNNLEDFETSRAAPAKNKGTNTFHSCLCAFWVLYVWDESTTRKLLMVTGTMREAGWSAEGTGHLRAHKQCLAKIQICRESAAVRTRYCRLPPPKPSPSGRNTRPEAENLFHSEYPPKTSIDHKGFFSKTGNKHGLNCFSFHSRPLYSLKLQRL